MMEHDQVRPLICFRERGAHDQPWITPAMNLDFAVRARWGPR